MSNEEKIYIKTTKAMLNHFRSEDYTLPLMLSEFIDNSISSWEKTSEKIKGLKIEINFIENKVDNLINREIQIKDNANGMNYYDIDDAGKFYDSTNKGKSDLNQHGIGLKSSIGWLGEDATIYSKIKNDSKINVLKFETSNLKDQDEFTPVKSQRDNHPQYLFSDSGTIINITKLHNDNIDNILGFVRGEDEEKTSALLTFLGWKYKHYIRNGLFIQLSFKLNDNYIDTKYKNYLVGDFDIKPWKLSDFANEIKKKNAKNNSEHSIEFETNEIIDNFKQSIKNIHDKTDITSIKAKICEMILRDQEVFIEDIVTFEDKSYKINYGIISPCSIKYVVGKNNQNNDIEYFNLKRKYGYKDLQGISTFHHNRGIEIGPNLNKDFWKGKIPETISFAGEDRQKIDGISTPIRLYGEIHIDDFKTEINKATLFWEDKDSFIIRLKNIWSNDFKDILSEMTKAELATKKSAKLNVTSIQKITSDNISKMKFDDDIPTTVDCKTSQDEDGNLTYNWIYQSFYRNQKYIFNLIESKIKDGKPFECHEISANHYEIKYDFNHSIWHPINKGSSTNIRTLSHPIIVTLALAQWIIEDNKSKYNNSINEKINIFDIIDEIVKKWEVKEND